MRLLAGVALFAVVLLGVAAASRPPAPKTQPTPSRPTYLVVMVLDGGRPDYFHMPGIPHISQLVSSGTEYANAWAGILESDTPAGHATIATGSQPRDDGILGFAWADSRENRIDLFNPQAINSGELERFMRAGQAPTIAHLVHEHVPGSKVVATSGWKYYAADALGGPDGDATMYFVSRPNGTVAARGVVGHSPPPSVLKAPGVVVSGKSLTLGSWNHLAMNLAARSFERMRQRVTLINLPEFDWPLGHIGGGSHDHRDAATLMRRFDSDLSMLQNTYRRAGVLGQTLFVITADHGMSYIDHQVPSTLITRAVASAGTRVISQTYHTAAFLWLKDKSRVRQAAAAVARIRTRYIQSVYFHTHTKAGWVYQRATNVNRFRAHGMEAAMQYLLHTFDDSNGPDLVVFFPEGTVGTVPAQKRWKGDHIGATWESEHLTLIFSGPGVRRGYVSRFPASLIDVAPTALALMGIPSAGMRGIPLADAMLKPTKVMRADLSAQGKTLTPLVTALRQESQLDRRADRVK